MAKKTALPKFEVVPISQVHLNERNPRTISKQDFNKLKKQIQEFPEMLGVRALVVDKDYTILGGNMRYRALLEMGYEDVIVIRADKWTNEQIRKFIVLDNVPFGKWDFEELLNDYDAPELFDMGVDVPDLSEEEDTEPGEIVFSPELDRASNYVVLKFDTDIDFIQIQTLLGLESVYSMRQNGKPWSKGIGRVVDGVDAIEKIKSWSNEN